MERTKGRERGYVNTLFFNLLAKETDYRTKRAIQILA